MDNKSSAMAEESSMSAVVIIPPCSHNVLRDPKMGIQPQKSPFPPATYGSVAPSIITPKMIKSEMDESRIISFQYFHLLFSGSKL